MSARSGHESKRTGNKNGNTDSLLSHLSLRETLDTQSDMNKHKALTKLTRIGQTRHRVMQETWARIPI